MFGAVLNAVFFEILLEFTVLLSHATAVVYEQAWLTSKSDTTKPLEKLSNLGRNVITNIDGRWPGAIIPYVLDETYEEEEREMIRSAMDEFEKETCISWIERSEEDDYVEIQNDMGCLSEVGYKGQMQTISLEAPLCISKGRIMHELMHTLGFLHEHSRPDRDDYVYVVWDNVLEGYEADFQALPPEFIDDQNMEYDYKSVMHYTSRAYSRNPPNPTLMPTNGDVNSSDLGYGLKKGVFTELDIEKINKFYDFSSFCYCFKCPPLGRSESHTLNLRSFRPRGIRLETDTTGWKFDLDQGDTPWMVSSTIHRLFDPDHRLKSPDQLSLEELGFGVSLENFSNHD